MALVAIAGRRYTYNVYTYLLTYLPRDMQSSTVSAGSAPPTHNREPYDTLLSDTMAIDPSVEPMPLFITPWASRTHLCSPRPRAR